MDKSNSESSLDFELLFDNNENFEPSLSSCCCCCTAATSESESQVDEVA